MTVKEKTFRNTHSAYSCFPDALTTVAFVHFPNLPSHRQFLLKSANGGSEVWTKDHHRVDSYSNTRNLLQCFKTRAKLKYSSEISFQMIPSWEWKNPWDVCWKTLEGWMNVQWFWHYRLPESRSWGKRWFIASVFSPRVEIKQCYWF